jgi:hypothetical protein
VGDGGVVDPNDMVNATAPQITWTAAAALSPSGGGWTQDAGVSAPAPASTPATPGKKSAQTKTLALHDLPAAKAPTGPGPAPGAACTGGCTKSFGECRDTCKGGTSCTACDGGYRSCMRSCFK